MFGTIETTHGKIIDKINIVKSVISELHNITNFYKSELLNRRGKKYSDAIPILDALFLGLTSDQLDNIETSYNLSITIAISDYYSDPQNEWQYTQDYYRIITSENYSAQIDDIIEKCKNAADAITRIDQLNVVCKENSKKYGELINSLWKKIKYAQDIEIDLKFDQISDDICKCGARMIIVPEFSERRCEKCQKIKTIIGVVFRDEQFYPQDGQKNKHSGYDSGRHYRFWMERIQALENKAFSESDMEKINYVINRDAIDRKHLNIVIMRSILKEVKLTRYNDHAALLIVRHGGLAPPRLDFGDNCRMGNRFHKAMNLYDRVVPDGGNKPYYPYFIYKIIEYEFRNNFEKLRLLDYIHLQSRETVVKNDKIFQKICELSDNPEEDGLFYTPTDPSGRV